MARRSLPPKKYFDPLAIVTASESKVVSLTGPQLAMVSHVLEYARTHGPAVYGTQGNRFPEPLLDNLISETADVVGSDVLDMGSWDEFKSSVLTPVSVPLSGPQLQMVRSVLSYAVERGNAFFGVPNEGPEADAYQAMVSDALSKL